MSKVRITEARGMRWKHQRLFSWKEKNSRFMKAVGEDMSDKDLAAMAGTAVTTVARLRSGETMFPKHETLARIAQARGYEFTVVKVREPDYENELPMALEAYKDYQKYLRQKREEGKKREKKRLRANRKHTPRVARRASDRGESRRLH